MANKVVAIITESKSDYYEFITLVYVLSQSENVSLFYYGSRPANTNASADYFGTFKRHYDSIGFDAIVFIGEKETRGLINEALRQEYEGGALGPKTIELCKKGGLIAAIGEAPSIFGKLGLLKGKKYTCLDDYKDASFGGTYTGKEVEKDGNIITAKCPNSAIEFSLSVAEHLLGKEERNKIEKQIKGLK